MNGASGFLLKDAAPALLVEAVRAAGPRRCPRIAEVTVRLLQHVRASSARRAAVPEPADPLSDREEEALRLVALGHTNAEIGELLFVSPSTVKSHLANLQAKLGARNRVELATWAWQSGRMD